MCGFCPNVEAEGAANMRATLQELLSNIETSCYTDMLNCYRLKDLYRRAGIKYHKTNTPQAGEDFSRFQLGNESIDRLILMFEITSVEQYKNLFGDMDGLLKGLADLRRKARALYRAMSLENRFPQPDSLQERIHYIKFEIEPTSIVLANEVHNMNRRFEDVAKDAYELFYLSPSPQPGDRATYCAWVGSLPEVHRMVAAGYRSLDEIASEMMLEREEKDEGDECDLEIWV